MEVFVLTMFWMKAITTVLRVFILASGAYQRETSAGIYAADTGLTAFISIWACFVLWY